MLDAGILPKNSCIPSPFHETPALMNYKLILMALGFSSFLLLMTPACDDSDGTAEDAGGEGGMGGAG